ncbi:MAG TPA: hypothetical protein VK003_01710 [Oceanobacillus sp.]|nr:hypothetical protein [Oceanobacillus sp.]
MSTNNTAELLRQGIEDARAGRRAAAREKFERVVELDENSEKGWFWLASVVDTDEERRICLANVVHINPNNERARKALDALNAKQQEKVAEEEVMPGITRRQLTLIAGGGAAIVVVLILILVIVTAGNNQRIAEQTAQFVAGVQTGTALIVNATVSAEAATATQLAIATPTPEPTATLARATLPPTWTPTPEPTQASTAEALPPPTGVSGILSAWGGADIRGNGFLPVGIYNFDAGLQFQTIGSALGRDVRLFPTGQRVVYTAYDNLLFSTSLEAVNTNGSEAESLPERWIGAGILQPEQPAYSPDGFSVVFIASPQDAPQTRQVFVLSLSEMPPGADRSMAVRNVSNDNLNYSYPSFSPDGTRIVAVRTDPGGGTDIVVIDVASGAKIPITNDQDAFIETMPRFSPDGTQIVYAVAPRTEPNNNDIFIISSSGGGAPSFLIREPANELYPVVSRDGQFLAFSSNRNGNWEIYILNINTQELFQLTNSPNEQDYPGDWY